MFFGTYGAFEDGTDSEWVAVRKKDLCLIPDNVDDVSAAVFRSRISPAGGSYPGWFSGR